MNSRQKVFEMLDGFQTAMMITRVSDGALDARPMQIADIEPEGGIWFLTSTSTRTVAEIGADATVLLIFQSEHRQYLALRGRARVVKDDAKTRRLWKEAYKVWFPTGPETPDLTLIAVDPEVAEFWDNTGTNKLQYLFEAAKAYVEGERLQVSGEDQHGRTRM